MTQEINTGIRILNVEPTNYSREAFEILCSVGEVDERDLSCTALRNVLPSYHVLIVRLRNQISPELIDLGVRLKAIVTATTGLDHIDVGYAKDRGIDVLSLKGENEFLSRVPATAEHTWGLLLALTRRIPAAADAVQEGSWDRDAFRGRDLNGKRLGIVGYGRIGRIVARYAQAFGMSVMAYDPHLSGSLPTSIEMVSNLEELARNSEILSVHAALSEETVDLVGDRVLEALPEGALLVNTARGAIVNSNALLNCLESGWLGGAALDVIPGERHMDDPDRNRLLAYARSHDNLIITPHIGGATLESMWMTEVFIAKKLKRHLQGVPTSL